MKYGSSSNIKILVVTHKKYQFPKDKIYRPIEVNSNVLPDFGYLKDNTGKNIADKNPNYCELTAMYWAWKNLNCDVIGINHYRRYLSLKNPKAIRRSKSTDEKLQLILSEAEVVDLLNNYDLLAPSTKLITKTVRTKYAQQHHIKDLDNCRRIIKERCKEYIPAFEKVMKNKEYYICNMCVIGKKQFDDYCKWLFDILFELEKITDLSGYSPLQKRIYGFLSERLFNVWIEKNKFKVKRVNMVSLEKDSLKTLAKKSYRRLLHIKS